MKAISMLTLILLFLSIDVLGQPIPDCLREDIPLFIKSDKKFISNLRRWNAIPSTIDSASVLCFGIAKDQFKKTDSISHFEFKIYPIGPYRNPLKYFRTDNCMTFKLFFKTITDSMNLYLEIPAFSKTTYCLNLSDMSKNDTIAIKCNRKTSSCPFERPIVAANITVLLTSTCDYKTEKIKKKKSIKPKN